MLVGSIGYRDLTWGAEVCRVEAMKIEDDLLSFGYNLFHFPILQCCLLDDVGYIFGVCLDNGVFVFSECCPFRHDQRPVREEQVLDEERRLRVGGIVNLQENLPWKGEHGDLCVYAGGREVDEGFGFLCELMVPSIGCFSVVLQERLADMVICRGQVAGRTVVIYEMTEHRDFRPERDFGFVTADNRYGFRRYEVDANGLLVLRLELGFGYVGADLRDASVFVTKRIWAEHEHIHTVKQNKLGFAKVAQLVEITTYLKRASCRQHGGGYVLPWIMDDHDDHRPCGAAGEDREDGDPQQAAWGARPVGTFSDEELRRPIVMFTHDGTASPRKASVVFGERATTLLPYDHVPPPAQDAGVEGVQTGKDDWTDPEDLAPGGDKSVKQVYFTYGGGSNGLASRTSVITNDALGPKQGVKDEWSPEGRSTQPSSSTATNLPLRTRKVIRVDSREDEPETEERLRDARFDPSHHSFEHSQLLRRSARLAGQGGVASQHLEDIPLKERTTLTPSHDRDLQDTHDTPSLLRTSNFDIRRWVVVLQTSYGLFEEGLREGTRVFCTRSGGGGRCW
ncbi:hypothetical protein CBR_g46612 [Chara braunii]|uniref:Uncharacterized protein n=1 Tax=Chara braunii TaxID=69332 RepID=A0A388M0X1_CHABU|nr:hypothetical protein CBR_g46612 [Chara braunii]|eukprot:GBG88123.1 hypothetical protein CBR_g46612 [Chara braunii]